MMKLMEKIYNYTLMIFISVLFLLIVSVFIVGWNVSVGNIDTKEYKIPTAEVKIVGKSYDSSIRLSNHGNTIFLEHGVRLKMP